MQHSRDWYIVPCDLYASLRELLSSHKWKETEIGSFLEIFSKYEIQENPLFSDFQNELIHKKGLSRLKKKYKQQHSLVLFLLD